MSWVSVPALRLVEAVRHERGLVQAVHQRHKLILEYAAVLSRQFALFLDWLLTSKLFAQLVHNEEVATLVTFENKIVDFMPARLRPHSLAQAQIVAC